MNNHRLLTWLLAAALLTGGADVCGRTRRVITIDQLFEIAETNSIQLRPSFTLEEEARREISVARSNRLPDINTSLSLSYVGDGFTTKRDFSDYQRAPIPHLGSGLSITVTQPVFAGGAITNGIELARYKSMAARFSTDLQRDNIRFQLAGFYLDIYKFANLRAVVEKNTELARKVVAEMKARHEQGVALQNDVIRYELLVENLKLQLIRIDNTIDILNRNLVTTAGLPDDTEIVPDTTLLARSLPLSPESWWQQEAENNAPTLKLAGSGVEISRRNEAITKSERLPKIGLQVGWNINGPILVEVPPINRNLSYWYVGVGISYNLSSVFKTNKSLSKSRAATRAAIDRADATRENITLGVRADYIRYLEAYEELKTQQKSVELAVKNYNIISTRYMEGIALITDMLDAANSRLDAELQLVNARIDIIYNYYKLLFTSGKI